MLQVRSLLADNGTLYEVMPSTIATQVRDKLLSLERNNLEVLNISAVPDFHSFSRDGGVKDIFFLCRPVNILKKMPWRVIPILEDDKTFYSHQTDHILETLQSKLDAMSSEGSVVRHLIMLTDHHNFAFASGTGGYDGLKNILICYY